MQPDSLLRAFKASNQGIIQAWGLIGTQAPLLSSLIAGRIHCLVAVGLRPLFSCWLVDQVSFSATRGPVHSLP